jgi:hypothetical protein
LKVILLILATNLPEEPKPQDGITFERDGTALAGRESDSGWIDLSCDDGILKVLVVNNEWEVEDKDEFKHPACENGKLEVGQISVAEIPKSLRD